MRPSGDTRRPVEAQLVEYLVVVVPDEAAGEVVIGVVAELERRGLIVILDLAFVTQGVDGRAHFADPAVPLDRWSTEGPRKLFSERDLSLVAAAVQEDRVAVVILVEDTWAGPLADAARAVGGYVGGGERLPPRRLHVADVSGRAPTERR